MTELRNRPGEVLDRVAQNGELFIIERNGSRRACLVPLSFFLPDIPPSRIAEEIRELEDHQEKARTAITEDRELLFRFQHQLDDGGATQIKIVLPHGYPSACPRVYADPVKDGAPHRWSDGALCLYGVMSGWNPGRHTVFSTLKLARQWLQHYDRWRHSGNWPKQEGTQSE